MGAVSARRVSELLAGSGELALLDVREQGVHYRGHPFFACSAPLSRLELVIGDLVPRRTAPIVVLDAGNEGLAEKAEKKLKKLGYTDVSILEGGCAGWKQAGLELFSGVNVPSKAFGEFVEHQYGTPRIAAGELKRLQEFKKILVLDSRPFEEYHRMNIPGGIDVPGAELVYRIHDLAPSPDTLVVVNCAGRTRSIIGCQSLRNAGIPNPVAALKDGTMGWELAGLAVERGAERVAPAPSAEGRAKAHAAAERVATRFAVRFCNSEELSGFRRDTGRTLYLLDVRTREEFEHAHVSGSRHAPGGQLVQASDEYVGVRNARVVLVDPDRVRAIMTASWLNQMGWSDVYVLEDPELTETGPLKPNIPVSPRWQTVSEMPSGAAVLDLSTSLRFAKAHIPGAWWGVRSRLHQAQE
ncbi:MAG TPA: rhodanese-like domain-containing protein, partial [Burkholderiales bacterium]|nr:rhodanese-like domain-containing protein [Burkholderiales bacterium]